jgi:hypothetical protein
MGFIDLKFIVGLILLVGVISVLPDKLCLFGSCLYFDALHNIKNLVSYFVDFFILYAYIGFVLFVCFVSVRFLVKNRFVWVFLNFLLKFDEMSWKRLVNYVSSSRGVRSFS